MPGTHDFVWGGAAPLPSGDLEFRVRARNTADSVVADQLWSAWSGWTAGPAGPAITSSAWPQAGSWLTEKPAANTFTFTAAGAVSFRYQIDGGPVLEVPATNGSATLDFLSDTAGPHVLSVRSVNAAGVLSPARPFGFGWGSAVITTPVAESRSSRTFRVRATAPAGMTSASIQWRTVGATDWIAGPLNLALDTSGEGTSLTYVWDTTTVPGAIPQNERPKLIEVRVTFDNPAGPLLTEGRQVTVTQSFGGAYATVDAGPCTVSVATGECQITATDADLPGYGQALTVGRAWYSQSDLTRRFADDRGVFGPGWVADLPGPEGGGLSATVVADLDPADPGTDWISLTFPDGLVDMFTRAMDEAEDGEPEYSSSFEPSGETRQEGSRLELGDTTLQLFEDDGTITTWTRSGTTFTPLSVSTPGENVATRFLAVESGGTLDRAAISGVTTGGQTCADLTGDSPEAILAKAKDSPGCRVLEAILAPRTTATASRAGAFVGQVQNVIATYYDPGTDSMDPTS